MESHILGVLLHERNNVVIKIELTDMRSDIVEDIIVVRVRLGRSRVREGDVVTTVVIALVAGSLVLSFRLLGTFLVLRLPEVKVLTRELHLFVLRLSEFHIMSDARLRAILADFEQALHLFVDDGPLRLLNRLIPAGEVIITEDLNILISPVFCEHWVDQEDWREESLPFRVNWLFVPFLHLKVFKLRKCAEARVFSGCFPASVCSWD